MNWSRRLPLLVALLLVSSAALFAVGAAIEHSQKADHHDTHAESSPGAESGETSAEEAGSTESESEEIAGIDPESWPLVGLAIAVSLVLAAGVYLRRGRWLIAAAAFGLLFAAADTRELVHQIDESRTTVAVIAGILIALHLLAALAAGAALRRRAGGTRQPVSVI